MTVESASYIADLNAALPASTDGLVEGDNHLRVVKGALLATLPNFDEPLDASPSEIDTAIQFVNDNFSNPTSLRLLTGKSITSSHTQTGWTAYCFNAQAQSSAYDSYSYIANVNRAATSSYSFFVATSSNGSDIEFNLRGDGNAFCDGSWSGGGADYAEWFEWDSTPPEDPIGWVVTLKGDKIVLAQEGDEPLGVTSATAGVIGNSAELNWNGRWLKDSLGRFVVSSKGERVRNPSYNAKLTYQPRSARKEWVPVGLLGKLRVRKGQWVPKHWKLLRQVDSAVDEYFVR